MTTQEKMDYLKDFGQLVNFMNEKLEKEGQTQVNLSTYNEVVESLEQEFSGKQTEAEPKKKKANEKND